MLIEIPDHEVKAIVDVLRIWKNMNDDIEHYGEESGMFQMNQLESGFGNYRWLLEEIASQYKPTIN